MDANAESRSYVEHLRTEHRHLQRMIADLHQAISAWVLHNQSGIHQRDELIALLGKVYEELDRHFAAEEEGGCLEEALSHNPGLSADVKVILLDHPALLKGISDIIALLRGPELGISPSVVQTMFDSFAHSLRLHEAAEERVMQLGVGLVGSE